MKTINLARVVVSGLAAGLVVMAGEYVLNGVVLADQWNLLREQHQIDEPSTAQFAAGAIIILLYGITLTWIYAAIRPRFGPGPKTAIIAGLTFWFIAYVLFLASVWANGMANMYVAIVSVFWGLFEAPIAALVGGWLYREGE